MRGLFALDGWLAVLASTSVSSEPASEAVVILDWECEHLCR